MRIRNVRSKTSKLALKRIRYVSEQTKERLTTGVEIMAWAGGGRIHSS